MTTRKTLTVTLLIAQLVLLAGLRQTWAQLYYTREGKVSFLSEAPLERIEAESDQVQGLLDLDKSTFAFSVSVRSFRGFNSPLQQEHFNENYLESDRFPKASFSGRILDPLDPQTTAAQRVRVKGDLEVHGITAERIIEGSISISPDGLTIRSVFLVELEAHEISIPRIMFQKLASQIRVEIEADLSLRP